MNLPCRQLAFKHNQGNILHIPTHKLLRQISLLARIITYSDISVKGFKCAIRSAGDGIDNIRCAGVQSEGKGAILCKSAAKSGHYENPAMGK
jgi:hypothetical protein